MLWAVGIQAWRGAICGGGWLQPRMDTRQPPSRSRREEGLPASSRCMVQYRWRHSYPLLPCLEWPRFNASFRHGPTPHLALDQFLPVLATPCGGLVWRSDVHGATFGFRSPTAWFGCGTWTPGALYIGTVSGERGMQVSSGRLRWLYQGRSTSSQHCE